MVVIQARHLLICVTQQVEHVKYVTFDILVTISDWAFPVRKIFTQSEKFKKKTEQKEEEWRNDKKENKVFFRSNFWDIHLS